MRLFVKPVGNGQDGELLPVSFLEYAFPVAKFAGGIAESNDAPVFQVQCLQFMEYILYLHAVSPDILHRAGAYITRYQRQVFQPGQALRNTMLHKPMPVLPCARFHIYMVVIFSCCANSPDPVF